jgi:hypothetical protein
MQVNANGALINGAPPTEQVPQPRIWNQYAAMYDFYQVKHISFRFVPYRFQGTANSGGTSDFLNVQPTVSIIDPDTVFPASGGTLANFS